MFCSLLLSFSANTIEPHFERTQNGKIISLLKIKDFVRFVVGFWNAFAHACHLNINVRCFDKQPTVRQMTHFIYLLVPCVCEHCILYTSSFRVKWINEHIKNRFSIFAGNLLSNPFSSVCKQSSVWIGRNVTEKICHLSAIWFAIQIIWIEDLQWISVCISIAVSFNCQISKYIPHTVYVALHHIQT